MNQFFKNVFASCLGVGLAIIGIAALFVFIGIGLASSASDKKVDVKSNSVLQITFSKPIPEQTNNLEMNPFDLNNQHILGLNDIEEAIDHAASDEKIKGIYLNLDEGGQSGIAKAASIRQALVKFKESGKFIVSYSKYYTQGAYYISSVADQLYVNPLGGIDFHGFSAMIPFFKDMLDKVGVKMQVFYAGDFKSATEPYRLNEMSEQNRLQLREYLEPVFTNYLSEIGQSRNKSPQVLRALADSLKIQSAEDAVTYGLADKQGYVDDVIADLKERLAIDKEQKINLVSLDDYATSYSKKKDYSAKNKIAVVYAEGSILANNGDKGTIVDDEYVKILRKIRQDEKFKAIVLRVNSPGGSALASDNIWRELVLAKEAGQKVVVSMGDYAASGGYYISCMADKIYAEPNTLTGSIGVFQMMPNASELFNDKLGIHWDSVKTTANSTGINPFFDLSPQEKTVLQASTNRIYETFLQKVAEGRNMTRDDVHKIAQGRIWTGTKAKELGLVDDIGSLDAAISEAAKLSGIESYRIAEYPIQKEPLQSFIEDITGEGDDDGFESKMLQKEMGTLYPFYKQLKEIIGTQGVQARLPVLINFN
ncbi:MAG: signal peptide peptidase SppA [Lewinellaceae bacterium]|nr:signal peptide peptidase SppA [Saprospiraceae bacterium]MCB9340456.1 signal peptide peptidase SppA [Lewinellaceae bacterium]